jgi:GDP-L-fucose synthase
MNKNSKIFIAGHKGLVGSAIKKNLEEKGYGNFILATSRQLDLRDQEAVAEFFAREKPEYVFLAAAKVGGIVANNTYRGEFIYDNLMIQNNIIHHAYLNETKKLLFLGSTCIYPREAPQPMKESSLLEGTLEYTNEPYAIAKIAGIKMCESYNIQYGTNFISVMPTNLYGPYDNFDLEKSHVLPALLRKIHLAKCLENDDWTSLQEDLSRRPVEQVDGHATKEEILRIINKYGIQKNGNQVQVEIWGTGKPMREFLWSEEMADACVFIMENVNFEDLVIDPDTGRKLKEVRNTHINIGTGKEISIAGLAQLVKETIGFNGRFVFNTSKPDGTLRKLTDVTKLHGLGWKHRIEIEEGVRKMYQWYVS